MEALNQIITLVIMIWVMAIAFGLIFAQGRGGWIVFAWPIRTTFRLVRRAVGGVFVALGNWIRG